MSERVNVINNTSINDRTMVDLSNMNITNKVNKSIKNISNSYTYNLKTIKNNFYDITNNLTEINNSYETVNNYAISFNQIITKTNSKTNDLLGATSKLGKCFNLLGVEKLFDGLKASKTFMNEIKDAMSGVKNCFKCFESDIATDLPAKRSDASESSTERFEKQISNLKAGLARLVKFAATTSLIAGSIIANITSNIANVGKAIKDNAQKVLMNTTAYQEWGYVCAKSGVDMSVLADATLALKKTHPELTFEEAVKSVQDLATVEERAVKATELFGERTATLMPILNSSSEETERLMQGYRLLGATMSDQLIAKSDAFTGTITEIKVAFQGITNTIGELLMPVVTKVAHWIAVALAYVSVFVRAVAGIEASYSGVGGKSELVSKSMKSAVGSAKEFKNTLMGFDELNVLSGEQATGGGESIGDFSGVFGSEGLITSENFEKLEKFKVKITELAPIIRDVFGVIVSFWPVIAGYKIWKTIVDIKDAVCAAVNVLPESARGIGAFFAKFSTSVAAIAATIAIIIAVVNALKKLAEIIWKFQGCPTIGDLVGNVKNKGTELDRRFNMAESFKNDNTTSNVDHSGSKNKVIAGNGLALEKFATGGFVDRGELFIAREAGPELVGMIGNSAAVMNNEQIVDAVARGVATAIGNQRVNVNVDGKSLFDIIVNRNNAQVRQTGLSPLMG